jgi:hypothetical protein
MIRQIETTLATGRTALSGTKILTPGSAVTEGQPRSWPRKSKPRSVRHVRPLFLKVPGSLPHLSRLRSQIPFVPLHLGGASCSFPSPVPLTMTHLPTFLSDIFVPVLPRSTQFTSLRSPFGLASGFLMHSFFLTATLFSPFSSSLTLSCLLSNLRLTSRRSDLLSARTGPRRPLQSQSASRYRHASHPSS